MTWATQDTASRTCGSQDSCTKDVFLLCHLRTSYQLDVFSSYFILRCLLVFPLAFCKMLSAVFICSPEHKEACKFYVGHVTFGCNMLDGALRVTSCALKDRSAGINYVPHTKQMNSCFRNCHPLACFDDHTEAVKDSSPPPASPSQYCRHLWNST